MLAADAPLAVPVDGPSFPAQLLSLDRQWQIAFQSNGEQRTLAAAQLVSWGNCREQSRAGGLVFADGSFLVADISVANLAIAGQYRLTAHSPLFGQVQLPLNAVAAVLFKSPASQVDSDKLLDRLASAAGDADRLLLDNGDELTGTLETISDDTIKLATDVGPVAIKIDRAKAVIFNPAHRSKTEKTTNALRAWAGFSDSSRLLTSQLLVEGDTLTVTIAGVTCRTKSQQLVFLQPLGSRVRYLSDLNPSDDRQTPYLDLPWPYQKDRNVAGGMLRCGGRLYLKGLGVHSAARLVYDLAAESARISPRRAPTEGRSGEGPGAVKNSPRPLGEGPGVRAARFEAEVGIDDSTARQGSAQFRVFVDGREKFISPVLRGGDTPVPVSVDIRGSQRLELIVDYADRADVMDHANWLNPRLVW